MAQNPSVNKGLEIPNMSDHYKKGVKNLVETSPEMNTLPSEFVQELETNPLSASFAEVPVIDLEPPPSKPSAPPVNSGVSSTSNSIFLMHNYKIAPNYFQVINHGIKRSLIEEMVSVADEFLDLSLEEKMKYASDDVMSPGTSLNTSKKHSLHWRDYFRHYGHPLTQSFHLWPLNPPKYRNVAKKYLEEIWQLAMKLGGAISEGLGLDAGYMEKSLGVGMQIIAANYYPPCPEPHKTLGLAAHSDHGGITILMQNGVDGLQIKHNHTWCAVQHVPGTFLVNIGDYLERKR